MKDNYFENSVFGDKAMKKALDDRDRCAVCFKTKREQRDGCKEIECPKGKENYKK